MNLISLAGLWLDPVWLLWYFMFLFLLSSPCDLFTAATLFQVVGSSWCWMQLATRWAKLKAFFCWKGHNFHPQHSRGSLSFR